MPTRILINGAQGRLGRVAVTAVESLKDFQLVAQCGRADHLSQAIKQYAPQVVIDVTAADSVYQNTHTILSHGIRPIIGTSGLDLAQVAALQLVAQQYKVGGIIAPNFSLGALLMMRFAQMAARYFPYAEIVEMHHEHKKDKPSGTARYTAEMIEAEMKQRSTLMQAATVSCGVPIHSVRMAGVLARQQVIFGAAGETLTIDHNTHNRDIYIPGIHLACQQVMQVTQLTYGLEQFLD